MSGKVSVMPFAQEAEGGESSMRISQWRGGAIISALVAAILVVILVVGSLVANSTPSVEAATSDDKETSNEDVSIEDLRVTMADLMPEGKCESDEFIANSLPSTDMKWSDSVSTPFNSNSPDEMFNEILKENCGNPTFLLMNVEGLSAVDVNDSLTIGSVNPWMDEFAKAFKADPLSYLLKQDGAVRVKAEVTQVAEMVNTLLHRLMIKGVVKANTLVNWHIAPENGLAVGNDKFPIATRNPKQYKGEFLSLEYTLKGSDCPDLRIGYNTGDKRLAELPVDCDKPPKDNPPPPPPKDGDINVCVIKGKDRGKVITIEKGKFNSELHSKNVNHPACKTEPPKDPKVKVCVIKGKGKGSIITIKESQLDSSKHSKNVNHPACKTEPPKDPKMKVCVKDTAKVITIKKSQFDPKKHTEDLSLCKKDDGGKTPPDKPKAPKPTDPPEKEPPVVETPDPDEKPGDETDVDAPGANPKPSPRPTPPPNEGGDEDGIGMPDD